jgi:hypothetical protein
MNLAVDLDETISNESPHAFLQLTDREEIYKSCRACTVKSGVEVLHEANLRPLVITGRRESLREITQEFLDINDIPHRGLIMVPESTYPNGFTWQEYYDFKIKAHIDHKITMALDDNPTVVRMLNDIGITAKVVDKDFRSAFIALLQERNRQLKRQISNVSNSTTLEGPEVLHTPNPIPNFDTGLPLKDSCLR